MQTSATAADRIVSILGDQVDYSIPDRSFSPCYSDIGLKITGDPGVAALWCHYNRGTTMFGAPFVAIEGNGETRSERTALAVRQEFAGGGSAEIAFYDRNAFVIDCQGVAAISFRFVPAELKPLSAREDREHELHDAAPYITEPRVTQRGDALLFGAYLPAQDKREPDSTFPIQIGFRAIAGTATGDGITGPLAIAPDATGRIFVAMTVAVLDIDDRKTAAVLARAPKDAEAAKAMTREWLARCVGDLRIDADDPAEERILARAAYSLATNLCAAPGILRGRVALFPARGSYAIVAPWDSCFQNLALEYMEPRLAADSLRILLRDGIRADGKIACFIASTWVRPELAQPALAGWAAERLLCRAERPLLRRGDSARHGAQLPVVAHAAHDAVRPHLVPARHRIGMGQLAAVG